MSFPLVEFENLATCETKRNLKTNLNVKGVELEHINPALGTLNGYTQLTENSSDRNIFLTGDVLFGKLRPYLKKYYFADFDGVCSTEIWVLRAKKNVSNKFLFYIVQSEFFARGVFISSGTRMPRANWDIVATTPVPLPPLDEQKRIAALLGAQDRQIEALSALIALRQRQFRGLVQALISTPAKGGRWNMVELGEIIKTVTPKIKIQSKDYLISGKYPIIDQSMNIIAGYTNNPAGLCSNPPYIIFGDHTCVTKYIDYPFVQGADGIKIFQSKIPINIKYLYFSIIGNPVIPEGYKRHFSILSQKSIPLPSAAEQERIASILGAAQRLIACLERKRELCLRRKKGLMQVLLTGKVRV